MLKSIGLAFAVAATTAVIPLTAAEAQLSSSFELDRRFKDDRITESSGIARSTFDRSTLWTHNDSGDRPRIFGVNPRGNTKSVLKLRGASNVDFEDISSGPGNMLWVADIGDDKWNRDTIEVYKVREPRRMMTRRVTATRYSFRFADGPRNAEALMVHPRTGQVFVVSKQKDGAGIYAAPQVLSERRTNRLTRIAEAPADITAGAFTPTGGRVVLGSYSTVYAFDKLGGTSTTMAKPTLPLGESLTVSRDGTTVLVGSEGLKSPVYTMALPRPKLPSTEPVTPTEPEPVTPTEPVTPVDGPLLGVYNGNAEESPDERTITEFGSAAEVSNTYYQPTQNINFRHESARIARGTSPNITITTKGTQTIAGIVSGDPTALAWLDNYVAGLKRIAALDPNVPVYATIEHEYRAKTKQGLVTGESADPLVYGKALDIFYKKANAASPNIETSYWFVGYDRTFEAAVGKSFTVNPDTIVFDPYANVATDTVTSITNADLNWIKGQPWYDGQPIGLGEFGMPVRHGDQALSKFFTNVRSHLKAQGIEWAVFFNRPRDNDHQISHRADGQTFPMSVAAFTDSL